MKLPSRPDQTVLRVLRGSFFRNSGATFAGSIVVTLAQAGLFTTLTHRIQPDAVGRYSLAVAVSAPIQLVSDLGLRSLVATDHRGRYAFEAYFVLNNLTSAIAILAVFVIALLVDPRDWLMFILVAGSKALDSAGTLYYAALQERGRFPLAASVQGSRTLISTGIGVAVLLGTKSITASLLGLVATSLAHLVLVETPFVSLSLRTDYGGSYRPAQSRLLRRSELTSGHDIWRLIIYSAPLGLTGLLVSLNTNALRYIVAHGLGSSQLAIFTAAAYVGVGLTIIYAALGQVALPRLATAIDRGDEDQFARFVSRLAWIGMLIGLGATGVSALVGRVVLGAFFGQYYEHGLTLLIALLAASAVASAASFFGYALTALGALREQVPVLVLSLVVTCVVGIALTYRFGLVGAGLASLTSSAIQSMAAWRVLRLTRQLKFAIGPDDRISLG